MQKKDALVYVYPDDREAFLSSMEKESLLQALRKNGSFMLEYRLLTKEEPMYVSMKVSLLGEQKESIVIGVADIHEQIKEQREAQRVKEERAAYARMNALTGDFIGVYVVKPENGQYREYSSSTGFDSLALPKEGEDFFAESRENARNAIHQEDLDRFLTLFTREGVMAEVERKGVFAVSYRLLLGDKPLYVQQKLPWWRKRKAPGSLWGLTMWTSMCARSHVLSSIPQGRGYKTGIRTRSVQ